MQRCQECDTEGERSGDHLLDYVEVCPDCGTTLRRDTAAE
jgi:rRNA maturation endonuclease Nob1